MDKTKFGKFYSLEEAISFQKPRQGYLLTKLSNNEYKAISMWSNQLTESINCEYFYLMVKTRPNVNLSTPKHEKYYMTPDNCLINFFIS